MQLYLDVGACLVGDLHEELGGVALRVVEQEVEDVDVGGGAHVVDVGDEDVLLALFDELLQQARVVEALVDVAVTGRVPAEANTTHTL